MVTSLNVDTAPSSKKPGFYGFLGCHHNFRKNPVSPHPRQSKIKSI